MIKKKNFKIINLKQSHKQILDIGIPEIKIIDRKQKQKEMLLTAIESEEKRPTHCPYCGNNFIVAQKKSTKQFRDLDIGIYRVGIVLHFRCYQCKNCKAVLSPKFSFIDGNFTKRMKEKIQCDSFEMKFADVARIYGIPPMTVGRFFREKAEEYWSTYKLEMPEILGIDELHLKKHDYGIFTNIGKTYNNIIDISENRNKDSIKKTLQKFAYPENLKIVIINIWSPYRDAINEMFPDIPIIIDKFHVIKELQKGLESIKHKINKKINAKRDISKNIQEQGNLQEKNISFKNNRFMLLFSMENLSPTQIQNRDKILNDYPEFHEPYIIKEAFINIYEMANSKEEALAQYEDWKKNAKKYEDFLPFIEMIENWKKEIFAYFDFKKYNHTNIQLKKINYIIKEKEDNGCCISYEVMRAKMIFRKYNKLSIELFDFDSFKA